MADVMIPMLRIDPSSTDSVKLQLVVQLRKAIITGKLALGRRLLPSRVLASQLGISRNSAVHAYEQLSAEGWLETGGRLGTYVASRKRSIRDSQAEPALIRRLPVANSRDVPPHLDWRLGQACTVAMPLAVWRAACREAGRHLPPNGYGDPRGDGTLRAAISQWLALRRGLFVDPEQIIVTQGAGHALDLLAGLLLQPGDVCVVENPGYQHAVHAFKSRGATVRSVSVDEDGMDVQNVFASRKKPAVVHVTAAHQYPLGVRLSGKRRRELLTLAETHESLIIENEYDHEFIHSGPNHAPLFVSAPNRVLLVSTFAKAISPALRLGFIVAPHYIANKLAEMVSAEKRHVSWPIQCSVSWLIGSGEMMRHLRRVHRHCARLRELIAERFEQNDSGMTLTGDAGGLHILVHLKKRDQTVKMEAALRKVGVALDSLDAFKNGPMSSDGILFGYGHMRPAELKQALDIIFITTRLFFQK